jgi:hypothetical protein
MSDRFTVFVHQFDFGREVEVRVIDALNPKRQLSIRIPELYVPDLKEMLLAIVEELDAKDAEKDDKKPPADLLAAFELGVNDAPGT